MGQRKFEENCCTVDVSPKPICTQKQKRAPKGKNHVFGNVAFPILTRTSQIRTSTGNAKQLKAGAKKRRTA